MKKIYLSPSNQDNNMYAVGGTNECEQCNKIAQAAKEALERCGFDVKKAPQGQAMYTSIYESNNWGADLHVPIHTNASNGMAKGTLMMVYDEIGQLAAQPIMENICEITPSHYSYGIRIDKSLAEINSTNAMATYIEVDFHDNPESAAWIIDNVNVIGEAICKGICSYYKVRYNGPVLPTPSSVIWEFKEGNWYCNKTNWVLDKDKWYFTDENGKMQTGWLKDGEKWYYLDKETGEMKTGWIFSKDETSNGWYYLDKLSGEMKTGWLWDSDDNNWYYLKPDFGGKMASSEYISEPSKMTKYWLNGNGRWIP